SVYVIRTSDADALRAAVDTAYASEIVSPRRHRIEVSFHESHALDLDQFLTHVRGSRDEVLRRVESIQLTVRYLGFRAGFAYLDGWPEEWAMPRRSTSRNLVPGGSFGIAATMSGFYPVDSPGGWNILGRTAAPLWDPSREPPNLFAPGDEISLVAGMRAEGGGMKVKPIIPHPSSLIPLANVVTPGQLTTIVGP